MAIEIRLAVEADAESVAALWNEMIRETLWTFTTELKTAGSIGALMAGEGGVFVAEEAGRIGGFASYAQFRSGPGYARSMEHSIVIAETHRGRGLGKRLLRAVEAHAHAKGYHTMVAGVSSANPSGRAFHAAMGYSEVGTLREVGRKAGRWLDLTLMQKILP